MPIKMTRISPKRKVFPKYSSLSQKNYVTQEVQFYNRQIEIGHL